jgi:hypothetical protein
MPRQPQLHGPLQVGGHAAQQGLLALLPRTARRDHPATPAFDDRPDCLGLAPLALGCPGKGPLALAAGGMARQAMRWPSRDGGQATLAAQVFSPPAVVGRGIRPGLGPQTCNGQVGPGVCPEGAKGPLVPSGPAVSSLSTQAQGSVHTATDHCRQVRARWRVPARGWEEGLACSRAKPVESTATVRVRAGPWCRNRPPGALSTRASRRGFTGSRGNHHRVDWAGTARNARAARSAGALARSAAAPRSSTCQDACRPTQAGSDGGVDRVGAHGLA